MWKNHVRPQLGLLLLLLIGALAALSACGDKGEASASAPPGAAAAGEKGDRSALPAAGRAMRITVELSVVAANVNEAVEVVRSAAREKGGYISTARTSGETDDRSADLELKIPVEKLGDFRAAVSGTGTLIRESETAEDVTEQRADLKARVRNAHAQEKRLLDLLSDRTGSLADVIAAEKSLAEVRDTIERLEALDATLEGQIAFATVRVHVAPTARAEPSGAADRVLAACTRGVRLLGQALVGTAVVFATLGPTALVLALFMCAVYRVVRAVTARRTSSTGPERRPMAAR